MMNRMPLYGERIFLQFLTAGDAEAVLALLERNREFFEPYMPARPDNFYTLEAQRSKLERAAEERNLGQRYEFGIYLKDTAELIGDISLFEIVRGPLQRAILGYSLDRRHNGKGYGTEAVRLAAGYGFRTAGLHRIEAGAMPRNLGSVRVLEKAGFRREGLNRKNVQINGVWEDHLLFALLEDEYEGPL